MFLDESGINSKLGERTYGRGKKGTKVPYQVRTGRAENLSLLPAFTVDGYLTCSVVRGAVNTEVFDNFVEQCVLPFCNPYPGPKSILVIDNATIHRSDVCLLLKIANPSI